VQPRQTQLSTRTVRDQVKPRPNAIISCLLAHYICTFKHGEQDFGMQVLCHFNPVQVSGYPASAKAMGMILLVQHLRLTFMTISILTISLVFGFHSCTDIVLLLN
jgi:hypothetical protein